MEISADFNRAIKKRIACAQLIVDINAKSFESLFMRELTASAIAERKRDGRSNYEIIVDVSRVKALFTLRYGGIRILMD
jgi:hypothetical protein